MGMSHRIAALSAALALLVAPMFNAEAAQPTLVVATTLIARRIVR